jgi:nudix-type nucleoside diphosphatase (YffH/AdpP family)
MSPDFWFPTLGSRFSPSARRWSGPRQAVATCAGLLEAAEPEIRIRQEAEEETGYSVGEVELVSTAFMSPGSVTERLFFSIGEYTVANRTGFGGGLLSDGEDIGVLELPFAEAIAMISQGEIVDGKTIMLLQHLQLRGGMEQETRQAL